VTRSGRTRTLGEADAQWQQMPGFVVYLFLSIERDLASNPLIWLCFWSLR
jgi:hypothetical protein